VVVLSPRPGRVAADIPIPFPFPRSLELSYSREFADVTSEVARALRAVSQ
jgi:NitT/TauT family transport system ATP-binding protein